MSTMFAVLQRVAPPHASAVVTLASAILPLVAERFVVDVMSAAGSGAPMAPALLPDTRKYFPGAIVTLGSTTGLPKSPAELAYWRLIPFSETDVVPRLKSSMKSFVN